MDDLISRKSLLQNIVKKLGIKNEDYFTAQESVVISCIYSEPSAESEQRWIPCSERLPEKNGRYLVTRGLNACGAMWNRVYIINFSDLMGLKPERIWWDGNVGKSDFERIDDVLAWMPLPEPWKGEDDE